VVKKTSGSPGATAYLARSAHGVGPTYPLSATPKVEAVVALDLGHVRQGQGKVVYVVGVRNRSHCRIAPPAHTG